MKCPYCGEVDSKVIDSRPTEDGEKIRRRRECLNCKKRFTTYEIVETVPLMVVRGYVLPAWVGPDTLVVASSHSGRTEETLAAVETAFQRRCPVAIEGVQPNQAPVGRLVQSIMPQPLLTHLDSIGIATALFPEHTQPI